jgi:hypothetical protein
MQQKGADMSNVLKSARWWILVLVLSGVSLSTFTGCLVDDRDHPGHHDDHHDDHHDWR